MINLSDKEKLIISSLYLQKQTNAVISLDNRVQMLKDYSLSLTVEDPIDLYQNLQIEEMNFISMFTLMGVSFLSLEPSNFTNIEKYVCYQTELLLVVGEIPYAVKAEFSKKLGEDLGIQNPELYLKLISEHTQELEKFISYYIKNSENL